MTTDQHPTYKNSKLPKDLILELAKDPSTKTLFQDKYIEAYNDLRTLDLHLKETLALASTYNQDAWVFDLIKDHFNLYIEPLKRKKARFHRLLMINTGNYKEPESSFDIPTIKQVPIEDLIPLENSRRSHHRIVANCPYHKEKTPSFVIYTEDNTAHCFGCQFHGDNINCVMEYHNLKFREACKLILGQ